LQALARRVVRDHVASRGRDWEDRFEEAWGAVVECLYSAPESEPPNALDLLRAGTQSLYRLQKTSLRDRGCAYWRGTCEAGAMPSFWRYWIFREEAPPEEAVVEQAALGQVMARLTPLQAGALLALAEHGGHQAAADALGVPVSTFDGRLERARSAFLALWHEHEAPSRKWRDRQAFGRALHGQPATRAEAAEALASVAEAFGGRDRIPSRDLLAVLAAADPGRYGEWDQVDLACFLRRHRVSRHTVEDPFNIRKNGRGRSVNGYWLEEVTAALEDLTAPGLPGEALAAAL
jgi:DNA-directed RNA polymerase specialized sigma24 family protein